MNIANVQFPIFEPYNKPTYEIYVSGCYRGCKGCHNYYLRDFNYGEKLDIANMVNNMLERELLFDIVSFLGGEPLDQDKEELVSLIKEIKDKLPNKKLWLFTGYDKKEVDKELFKYFDVIKVGCYIEELQQDGFPASSNQKVLIKGEDY